jgi:hypothetical protein
VNAPVADEVRVKPSVPIWIGLLVFALGVGGGWLLRSAADRNAIPIDASEWGVDQNGDGRDDLTYFNRVGGELAYKSEADRNFDGSTDEPAASTKSE